MNILVTGVSSGLGKELVAEFLSGGHHVWGIARKKVSDPLIQELTSNENFNYTQCDISSEENISAFINKISMANFNMDVVILNAAMIEDDFINKHLSLSKFKEIFKTNLFGNVSIIEKILPAFQRKGKGVFVGVSSLSSYRAIGGIGRIAYPATKSALNMTFEAFRLQINNPEIRFSIVNFGRMEEKGGLLKASYKQAAKKVVCILKKNKNVVDYPFLASTITKALRFLPNSFISKYLIKA